MGEIKYFKAPVVSMGIFIISGLIIGGIAAVGFLADEIGQALFQTGRLTNFENQRQVCDALIASNRPDFCQKLLVAQTKTDLSGFNAPPAPPQGIAGALGEFKDIALIGVLGFLAIKLVK